jgi:hypothetical protein
MENEDEDKTSFITPCRVYCYMSMSFGVRSAGATFQRLMHEALDEQMGNRWVKVPTGGVGIILYACVKV